MASKAERLKTHCEIAAYGAAALFLVLKFGSGQYNHGMDVSLELERTSTPVDPSLDPLAITVNFKRPDSGRIEVTDVFIETVEVTNPTSCLLA